MNKRGYLPGLLAILTGISSVGITTSSDSQEAASNRVIDEVIVTARRREEGLSDVPIAISTLSGDFIQETNMSDIIGLAEQVPNLAFGEAFNSSDRFAIRGISTNGTNVGFEQAVGFNIDGFYFGRSRFGQTMFLDLERIEILKGPQNTLIGKNNTAGAINIVTRKPGDESGGYIASTLDFDNAAGYALEGAFDIPFSENARARIAGRVEDRDGYVEEAVVGSDAAGAKDSASVRGILEWDVTPDFDATFLYQYGDIDRGARARELAGNCTATPPVDDCIVNNVKYEESVWAGVLRADDFYTATIYHIAGVTLNWQLNENWTLTSLTNYTTYEGDDISEGNLSTGFDTGLVQIQDDFDQATQEIRLLGSPTDNLDFIGGLYFNENTVRSRQSFTFCGGMGSNCVDASAPDYTGLMRNFDSTQDSGTVSVFGQIDIHLSDALTLGIGGRYTTEDKSAVGRKWLSDIGDGSSGFAAHQTGGGTPVPGTDYAGGGGCGSLRGMLNGRRVSCFGPLFAGSNSGDLSRSEDDFSPNAVLTWQPADEHMLYASWSEGFKGGGYQLWPVGPGVLTPARIEFDAEKAESLEIGGKHTLADGTLQLNWSAWNTQISGLQVSALDPAVTAQNITNAGETTSQGIETDFIWVAGANHRVVGAVALLDAVYDSYEGATCWPGQTVAEGCIGRVQSLSGQEVQYSPDLQYNIAVDGSYPTGGTMEWGWRIAYNWRDDQFIGSKNHPVTDIQKANGKADASLFLADANGKWRVSLIGLNLNDEVTGNFANDTNVADRLPDPTLTPNRPTFYFTAPGRQVAVQGRWNF